MPNYKHLTPDQHYIEAERLVAESREAPGAGRTRELLMEAQVHATLANFTPKGDELVTYRSGQRDCAGWAHCSEPLHRLSPHALSHFGINPKEWS